MGLTLGLAWVIMLDGGRTLDYGLFCLDLCGSMDTQCTYASVRVMSDQGCMFEDAEAKTGFRSRHGMDASRI